MPNFKISTTLNRPQTRKTDFVLAGFFGFSHTILATIVYHFVPDPYMDEVFHIDQTRRYCKGNYTWNPMITTPPALYILSIPFCGFERYVNSVLLFFAILGFCRFRRIFNKNEVWLTVSVVCLMPILLHSSVLFYTDLLSLTAVIWGFSTRNSLVSALFFTLATLCRQTNIIWAAAYAIFQLLIGFNFNKKITSSFSSLFKLWPFEFLGLSFLAFIYFNNFQIVLGDAKAHKPKFHLAQILYLFAFSSAHVWPHILASKNVTFLVKSVLKIRSIFLIIAISFGIHYFSFDHPYLLADNRHFTFYIWQRFLSKPMIRVSLAPIYVVSYNFMNNITRNIHISLKIIFLVSSFLVLVPAHLFEMRYFIIPFIIFRLSMSTNSKVPILLELLSNLIIFLVVFYLFLFKTFVWENEPDNLQRFMF